MEYRLSKTSQSRLNTCHKDLQLIISEALKFSQVDFGVAVGHRSKEEQRDLWASGRTKPGPILTKINGVNNLSKHNHEPSMAVDIYAYYDGAARWDERHLCYVAGVIIGTAKRLKQEKKISHTLRWGGNWDSDGVIVTDQSFQDLPHFELI